MAQWARTQRSSIKPLKARGRTKQAKISRPPPLVRGLEAFRAVPPRSNNPVAACQYIYHPISSIAELKITEPQAPRLTSQEKMASLGPKRKKGGNPPRAERRAKKARLNSLLYLWGWGQEVEFAPNSKLHPRPSKALKINITNR